MASDRGAPTAELLDLPDVYGQPRAPLGWDTVSAALEAAREYWFATVRPDGRPHVVPLDGLWVDDAWFYGGSEDAVHVRTALANPKAVMHLPDATKAVIVEGEVRRIQPPEELAQRLADHSNEKYADYGYDNDASAYRKVLCLRPHRVLAWTAFPADATRFTFPT